MVSIILQLFNTDTCKSQWVQCDGIYGGGFRCFSTIGSTILAGTWSGIMRSTNNGTNWEDVSVNGLSVRTLANYDDNIFAGTDSGVYKSTNNGIDWNETSLKEDVTSLRVDGNNIYALTIRRRTLPLSNISSIYYSSDKGIDWKFLLEVDNVIMRFEVSNGMLLVQDWNEDIKGGVLVSKNNGMNWSTTNLNFDLIYSFAKTEKRVYAGTQSHGIYYSTNNGINWITTKLDSNVKHRTVNSIAISENTIVAGTSRGVLLSLNNSESWTEIGFEDMEVHRVAINDGKIFATIDEGSFYSTDYGEIWSQVTINHKEIYSLTTNGDNIFARSVYNIYNSNDYGTTWIQNECMITSWDSGDLLASDGNNIYLGTSRGSNSSGLYISSNNCKSWDTVPFKTKDIYSITVNKDKLITGTSDGVFISTDKGNNWTHSLNKSTKLIDLSGNIISAVSANNVWISTNFGISWIQTGNIPDHIIAIKIVGNNIFVGTKNNGVYYTYNNGITWNHTSMNHGIIKTFAVYGKVIFAGTDKGIYYTSDNGSRWLDFNEGFHLIPIISSILITDNFIYSGTYGLSVWKRSVNDIKK